MDLADLKEQTSQLLDRVNQEVSQILARLKQHASVNVVGLDISSDAIKILKVNLSESGCEVENYSAHPLPVGAIVKDEVKNAQAIVGALKEAVQKAGITTKNIAFAIPRSSTIIKTVAVDARLNADEIESRAWIEANRLFPDLVGDIYLDFTITGPSVQDKTLIEFILVACRKDAIKPYLEVFAQAGLVPKIVDVNCYALERSMLWLKPPSSQQTIALLNLNKNLSTFIVVQGKTLIHAHDQSYDGQRLITQTQEYLKNKTAGKSQAQPTAAAQPVESPQTQPPTAQPIESQTQPPTAQPIESQAQPPAAQPVASQPTPAAGQPAASQPTLAPTQPLEQEAQPAQSQLQSTSLLEDSSYNDILKETLVSHLRHTIHFFFSSRPNVNVHQILLSGDCANIPALAEFIQREIGTETVIANPFTNMTFSPLVEKEKLLADAPAFMLCCGLALSEKEHGSKNHDKN